MTLGERIRKLRRQQGRTLEEIAGACGFTRSLLSKIESNKTVPPVATLTRIAAALGASVASLLSEEQHHSTVHTPAKQAAGRLVRTKKGYLFHAFAADRSAKLMQPYLFVAEKGRVRPQELAHRGEEFVYVLEGRMRYRVGSVEYRLERGDSLYFDAEEPHDLEPLTARVVYLGLFVERPKGGD
jgi:transcriptional regulator with XRE-family HTH domain